MIKKHIAKIYSWKREGEPTKYNVSGLIFKWSDWVVCNVSNRASNPVHPVIMTNFNHKGVESFETKEVKDLRASRWNPTYEDDYYRLSMSIDSLHYWQPVMVIPDFKFKTYNQE